MQTATTDNLISIQQASTWASEYLGKNITSSNISYLIQYGRIRRIGENGTVRVSLCDLEKYYSLQSKNLENRYKAKLGEDINWELSFSQVKESESTKHVHRLHSYKGKFIPQLVEYFIDQHTDSFKKEVYFEKGDVILDPFAGSGTTLVQASESGMHAVGIDVSAFNSLIANCKVANYDINDVCEEAKRITIQLKEFSADRDIAKFEEELLHELNEFNKKFFPSPEYKYKLSQKEVDEKTYGAEKEQEFLSTFNSLKSKYNIELLQRSRSNFLEKWFFKQVRAEIDFVFEKIKEIENSTTKKILTVVLSRTMRSSRATTHSDLATLIDPIKSTYYCSKHGKICKPLFSIIKWWESYCKDTIARVNTFQKLRTDSFQQCIASDSRNVDFVSVLKQRNPNLYEVIKQKGIAGIFSSPPYVGMINYHEQHAYAYDLFGFDRKDELEIGPLYKGKGKAARDSYVDGISSVLNNCKKSLIANYNVFLVANDQYNLYPTIADRAGMQIVNKFHRPVLNRSEKDKAAYSETIFHLKEASK